MPQDRIFTDDRTVHVNASPSDAFAPIRKIGGTTGWYAYNWLWSLRGAVDRRLGGIGLRRGRRDPENLCAGDRVDCWLVERSVTDRELVLALEMKTPGKAWLQFEVQPNGKGSVIRQTAVFHPRGLPGYAYWFFSYPFHRVLFPRMLRRIAAQADAGGAVHAGIENASADERSTSDSLL